nr:MAG TPA: hypothetical protein [Microviridae sp.]
MKEEEFREQVLQLQEEVRKTNFEWKKIFRIQTLNEEQTEFVIMIGDKLASKECFKSKAHAAKYIDKKPWELIATLMCSIAENAIKIELLNLKNKEK